ncbi:MAG: tetratricopeptide repeat protein [Bacteroidetes bacterium]|nr:tetratricopeptide repeat protein [Bacteroidota bacterium]
MNYRYKIISRIVKLELKKSVFSYSINFYFLFLFLCLSKAYSQNNKDCKKLLFLADSIYFSNPDSSFKLSAEAELCAKTKKDTLSEAIALSYKTKCYLLKSELENANLEINKAILLYKSIKNNGGLAYALKLKAILYKRLDNKIESIELTEESIYLYRLNKDSIGLISSLLNASIDYTEMKMFDKANFALQEIPKLNYRLSPTNEYYFHQNKGILFLNTEKLTDALSEFNKALNIAENENMIDSKATILMFLSRTERMLHNLKTAEKFAIESIELATKKQFRS